LELGLGRWPMVTTKTARRLTATSLRPRWRSHQRRARRCRLQRRRLATMRTGANYRLWMVGRQARHGGPTCGQNISWARLGAVAGGVAAWVARKIVPNGARTAVRSGVVRTADAYLLGDAKQHDFYFQNFFPKNLAKKLGRVLQWRISGTARVRVQ